MSEGAEGVPDLESARPAPRRGKLTEIRLAAGFLTILPLLPRAAVAPDALAASYGWFPLVGFALGALLAFPLMWCPGISAILTQLIFSRSLRGMGWGWGKTRYQLVSFFLPLLYAAVAYGVIWGTGLAPMSDTLIVTKLGEQFESAGLRRLSRAQLLAIYLGVTLTLGVVINCLAALGEEIGWRGFLVPELSKTTSFTATSLISGVIWSLWHYPVLIFGDYNAGTPTWYGLTCFTVMVISISFIFAWMRLKSGSVWTGMPLHASHNLFIQAFFDPQTRHARVSDLWTTEFGAGLAIASIIVALIVANKSNELPPPEGSVANAA